MSQTKTLSYKYNMSLGFIPVIIFFLLCEFTEHDIAIYISTGICLTAVLISKLRRGEHLPPFILMGTTVMFALLSLFHWLMQCHTPQRLYVLAIEISMMIPPLLLLLNQKHFKTRLRKITSHNRRLLSEQSAETTFVSARVVVILTILHLLVTLGFMLFRHPMRQGAELWLLRITPPLVYLLTILFNQLSIVYFNRLMSRELFLPIVNKQGDVVGKCLAEDALQHKNRYILPVIRIAVSIRGLLYLAPRQTDCIGEPGKTDLIAEDYLHFGETLKEGVYRILREQLPELPTESLRLNFMYHLENEVRNRLVYLFTLTADDDSLMNNGKNKGGKPWTFRQIEQNLHKGFFSSSFEYEFEELKEIIYTREKYKES